MRQVANLRINEIDGPHSTMDVDGPRWSGALLAWLLVCLLGITKVSFGADEVAVERVDCEFRIVWGGPTARTYEGQISVEDGKLSLHRNLSLQQDAIGAIRSKSVSTLEIQAHSAATFGGVDVDIQGTPSTKLTLSFKNPGGQQVVQHSATLSEILQGAWLKPLDDQGAKVAVERQIHDRIQVKTNRPHEVFDANELWDVEILGNRTGLAPGEYSLQVDLTGDRGSTRRLLERPISIDAQGNFEAVVLNVTAPAEESVYRLEVQLIRRRFFQSIIAPSPELIRRFEFVVFDAAKNRQVVDDWRPLALVDAFRASKPGALAWLSPLGNTPATGINDRWQRFNPLKGSLNQPISHGGLNSRTLSIQASSVDCLTLEPHAWLAIPLGALKTDRLHRLTVRVPLDQPGHLAVGIKQTNSQGEFQPIGSDCLFTITPRECTAGGSPAIHVIDFWPSEQNNFVVLANPDEHIIASVLDIQVDEAQLVSTPANADFATAPQPPPQRLVGVYLDKPLLADSFGSERSLDVPTNRALESWSTWQTACERLDQTLEWSQANLLMLKIQADGGAIFPSRLLSPTPRYDSGLFFSDGRSPDIKDGVELLLRHCDRSQVRVVLAMDLDSFLPGLKDAEGETGSNSIFQAKLHSPTDPQFPLGQRRYDPLNSKVQAELLLAAREVVGRYSGHNSFAGIAFQVDQNSQFVFGGDKWGYGPATLAAFEQFVRAKLPPPDQLPNAFSSSLRLAFMNWRAGELTNFFEALGEVVVRAKPDARFYLNATRLWDQAPNEADFFHPTAIARNPSEYLLAYGIDANRLGLSPKVILMQGKFQRPIQTIDAGTWIRQVAQERGLSQAASSPNATIVVQQPGQYRLREFSKFSSAVGAQASDLLFPIDAGTQQTERKNIVGQVFAADATLVASGAWLPLTSENSALRELRATLKAFPLRALQDFALQDRGTNMKVRTAREGSKSYLQLVNNAPWPEEVAIATKHSSPGGELRLLGGRDLPVDRIEPTSKDSSNTSTWQIHIPAYDVIGLETNDPEFQLLDIVHAPSDDVLKKVTYELDQMESIIVQASDPSQQKPLADLKGDFEQWSTEGWPAGWNVSSLPNVRIQRATELPHSGQSSLLIENANQGLVSAWIQSQPIMPPPTKRLAFQAWLRSPTPDRGAVVRLSVVGRTHSGARFECSQQFGSAGAQPIANDWGTKPATLYVSDIPTEELNEIYLAVELIGPGKVWVDDVRVLQSKLHPDERIHLQGQMIVARQGLAQQNPFPAEKMLDSHWGRYLTQFQTTPPSPHSPELQSKSSASYENSQATPSRWNESPTLFQEMRDAMRERWRR